MDETVYVIGHRNPDADAICSAIGYAAYKKAIGEHHWEAARCGNSNARIDAILKRFEHPLPPFVGDVTPRVRDIMSKEVHRVRYNQTCTEALEIIDRHDVRVLPVVDDEEKLMGTISIFQLGEYFIPKPREPREMRHVHTSINDIVCALDAKVLHIVEGDQLEDLYVRVGAMDIRSFGRFTNEEPTYAEQSIIVVGDRWDIQQKSIQAGVRLLVITGGLEVDSEVLQMARERNVSLIVSSYDSATSSWIIRSANRIERLLEQKFPVLPPDEKVSVVRRRIANLPAAAYMVTDKENRLLGVFTNADLIKPARTQLALVDHNEIAQAVPGADQVKILEIIDHHRLGNPPSDQPILFINEPVGSTCTIVADLFRRGSLIPEPQIAGILLSGIIADTLNLQSPTTTDKDTEIVDWLASHANVSPAGLADLIFSSGSVILSAKASEVIRADMKSYNEGDIRFSVSQVEELGLSNFWKNANDLLDALEKVRYTDGFYFSCLLVTDINTQNSLLAIKGDQEVINQITYPKVEHDEVFDLPGIVSRKKQLIPYLSTLLRSLGIRISN